MQPVEAALRKKITAELAPVHFELDNESDNHSGPAGRESHFRAVIVSENFNGLLPLKRHQLVYGIAAEEMAAGIHAFSIHAYTPAEWQKRQAPAPSSPDCASNKNS